MKRKHYYYLAVFSFFCLFSLLMLWHTILMPSDVFPKSLILIFAVGPLLLPFRGLLNGNPKSCVWMCYLSLFYLTHGIAEAYLNTAELIYALLEIVFSLLLCTGAGLFVFNMEKTK